MRWGACDAGWAQAVELPSGRASDIPLRQPLRHCEKAWARTGPDRDRDSSFKNLPTWSCGCRRGLGKSCERIREYWPSRWDCADCATRGPFCLLTKASSLQGAGLARTKVVPRPLAWRECAWSQDTAFSQHVWGLICFVWRSCRFFIVVYHSRNERLLALSFLLQLTGSKAPEYLTPEYLNHESPNPNIVNLTTKTPREVEHF